MKKTSIISLLLIFCIIVASLCGCKGGDDSVTNNIVANGFKAELVDENDSSIVGKTLAFDSDDDVVWDFGVNHFSESFVIKNVGDDIFEYEIIIKPVGKNKHLAENIDFRLQAIRAKTQRTEDIEAVGTLLPGSKTPTINILATLKEDTDKNSAGFTMNEVAITVKLKELEETESDDKTENLTPTATVTSLAELNYELSKAKSGDVILLTTGDYGDIIISGSIKENVTILGEDGVIANKLTLGYELKNFTINNIKFYGSGIQSEGSNLTGLSILNCEFPFDSLIRFSATYLKDLKIEGNTFKGSKSQVTQLLINGLNGAVIKNNTFESAGYNAMQITEIEGTLTIEGNKMSNTESRAIRLVTKSDAIVKINNNIMTNVNADGSGEVIKVSGDVTQVINSGNTHNGKLVEVKDGIGR